MRAAILFLALATPALAEPVIVPSGQAVTLYDVITDVPGPAGDTHRYRFLAPGISGGDGAVSMEETMSDMDHLCATVAIPRIRAAGARPAQIIISLSDREVEFGQPNPEITQFFEAYAIQGTDCIWEGF